MRYLLPIITVFFLLIFTSACHRSAYSEFSKVDRNGDGTISKQEYLKNWYKMNFFEVWDENEDGQVTRAEWNSALKQYYPQLTYSASLYQNWQMDRNESLQEKEIAQGLFSLLDRNEDAKLSASEYRAYR